MEFITTLLLGLIVVTSVFVVLVINPVYSILLLVLLFLHVAVLLLVLGFQFLAMSLIVVYIGAIAVLFLFVIMMLNLKVIDLDNYATVYLPFTVFFFLFSLEFFFISKGDSGFSSNSAPLIKNATSDFGNIVSNENFVSLGLVLYEQYGVALLLIGLILLLAIVGTIALVAQFSRRQEVLKKQLLSSQELRSVREAVFKVHY
jgi:NADH-quinone oxidoreductase subunit J